MYPKRTIRVSAPGKIIISGEHVVVYGYPALLASLDRRLSCTFDTQVKGREIISSVNDLTHAWKALQICERYLQHKFPNVKITIDTNLPVGSGMGSSAALAVAFAAGFKRLAKNDFDLEAINNLAYRIEKVRHGNPSGGDNTISTYGGFLWYRKESENLRTFSPIKIKRKLPRLYILDSGKPVESTGEMVAGVKEDTVTFVAMEKVTRGILRYLTGKENVNFGELMTENERLLEQLGVVSPQTRELIKKIEKLGGYAKISGAGGAKAGSGILLVLHKDSQVIKRLAKSIKCAIIPVRLGKEGVKVENS